MKRTDDLPDERLPVTAEVGGEGGSYADSANQVETFSGVFGNPRVDPQAVSAEVVPDPAAQPEPDEVIHATEPPDGER